ncbi:hypothetical protein EDD21DRAFT_379673 [Dissophora ornata]|nr:hypothetical protein EDD21DRAFT_379673 [Dissophora ornata]
MLATAVLLPMLDRVTWSWPSLEKRIHNQRKVKPKRFESLNEISYIDRASTPMTWSSSQGPTPYGPGGATGKRNENSSSSSPSNSCT